MDQSVTGFLFYPEYKSRLKCEKYNRKAGRGQNSLRFYNSGARRKSQSRPPKHRQNMNKEQILSKIMHL
jgi:hypothetical protein